MDSPFFIVGTGRCGTTLLQAMLSSHPRIHIPPETRYFGRMDPVVRFSDPLTDSQVAEYVEQCQSDLWWRQLGIPIDDLAREIHEGMRGSRDIFLWLLRHLSTGHAGLIGEKSPPHGLHMDRIRQLFPRAKFIHIYRDPRDVVASYLSQYWCTDRTGIHAALYCRHCLTTISRQAERFGAQTIISLRYESIVHDPERELRRLCGFLEVDFDPAMLNFHSRQDKGYLNVEEPWKGLTKQPLTDRRVGSFQRTLTPRQVFLVERILGKTLVRLDYQPTQVGRWRPDWHLWYAVRRLHRRVIRRLGLVKPLLDERKVRDWSEQHPDAAPMPVEASPPS